MEPLLEGAPEMTKYAISLEGAEFLRNLAVELSAVHLLADRQTKRFAASIKGVEDGLGIYGELILELTHGIEQLIKESEDSVVDLCARLIMQAEKIEILCNLDVDDSSDSDPIYAPKVKTRPFTPNSGGRSR